MNQYSINSQVQNGELNLRNLPFPDDSEVTVFMVSQMDLNKLSSKVNSEDTKDDQRQSFRIRRHEQMEISG